MLLQKANKSNNRDYYTDVAVKLDWNTPVCVSALDWAFSRL